MKIDKRYDPQAHFLEVQKRIQTELGEPVTPSWKEVLEDWNGKVKFRSPRSFMFVVDIKSHRSILTSGMNIIGYKDDWLFNTEEFIGLTHENQRRLLQYQTLSLYDIFLDYADLIYNKDVIYCTSRGIRDSNGKYHLAYQTAIPFQYDNNKVISRYLSFYQLLGEYKGQALETDIHANSKFPKEQKEIRKLMLRLKESMLEGLGFTRTQKQVIDLMAVNQYSDGELYTKQQMAEQLEMSPRTLERHQSNIFKIAVEAFPLNSFKDTEDAITYLMQQNIV